MLLGERNFCLKTVRSRPSIVEGLLRLHPGLLELLRTMQPDLCILELNLVVGDGGLGGIAVGFGGIESALDVGIVKPGEELALGDAGAFVEKDAGDAAGNLGGDSSAAAGRYVAAGIQQRLAAARLGFRGAGDLHHGLLTTQRIGARDDPSKDEHGYGRIHDPLAHARALALAFANA